MMKKVIIIGGFVLLLLVGCIIGFFLFTHKSDGITSPLQPTATPIPPQVSPTVSFLERDTQVIKDRVSEFYQTYQDCMKKPPVAARGRVSTYCQEHTGVTSQDFSENLAQVGTARSGADPITCSQTPPSSASADMVDYESPEQAVVTTVLIFGSGFAQKIPVVVVKEENTWKVSSVVCPRS